MAILSYCYCMMEKLNKHEIGYLAGFVDGEGSLIINKREHRRKHDNGEYQWIGYTAYIDIGNTNKEVLNWINKKTCNTSKIYLSKGKGNRKDAFRIRIGLKLSVVLLKLMAKWLIIKKEQSEVFLEFAKHPRNNKIREHLFQKMKKLNHRGR